MDRSVRALNWFFDLLLRPFGDHAWFGLAFVSLLAGVLLLWLFKLVTPQRKLARARGRLMGHLYELGLFQDDLRTLMRIQKDFALANLRYLLTALPALAVLVPVVGLVVVQLEVRYQHTAPSPGSTVLLAAVLDPDHAALIDSLVVETGPGLAADSAPVRDRAQASVWWRLRVEEPGRHEVALSVGDLGRWTKQVKADPGIQPYSPVRARSGTWTAFANPAETPLPKDSPLLTLSIIPAAEKPWYGRAWFWGFCLYSVIGGLAFKKVLRVEF